MGNQIVSSQFTRLLDDRLKEVIRDEFKDIEASIDTLYNRQTHDSAFAEYMEIGDVPDIPRFNGAMSYITFHPGFYTKIEPAEYGAAMQIERKLIDDDQYGVIKNKAGQIINSAARTMDKLAVRQISNSFSAAFDFQTSEEGVALCSNAHLTKSGASTSVGFDNLFTTAMNKTSVSAAYIALRRFRNDIGERVEIEPDTLIVPDSLAQQAYEITQTPAGLYSGEGTKNYWQGKFRVVVLKRLDDTSTLNWWMVDSKKMKRFLAWLDRIKPETETVWDFETKAYKTSVYFRVGNGFLSWRWIGGSQVS